MSTQTTQLPATQTTPPENNLPVANMPTPSQRFTAAVEKEFSSNAGEIVLTSFQKKLCQNYFIKIDMVLKEAEKKRMAKAEKYRDPIPLTWEYIDIPKLAIDVITFSSVGLDPMQSNHISTIPFKNLQGNKYLINFIMGYKGIELKARKYGFEVPDNVTVELVRKNDKFKQIKKDVNNPTETYIFEIIEDFNRGEIVGGFYYLEYLQRPDKNKIRVMTRADIEKRKPEYASAQFWGGKTDNWETNSEGNRVKNGSKEVEGWFEEMAYKTIYRAAFNSITIDSEKIDNNYLAVIQREKENRDALLTYDIQSKANGATASSSIGFDEPGDDQNNDDGQQQQLQQSTAIGQIVIPAKEVEAVSESNNAANTHQAPPKKKVPF